MKELVYCVAMSLDGYIAGTNDEFDWITMDPAIDFAALFDRFDVFVMGRRTFEVTGAHAGPGMAGGEVVVISTTLDPREHPDVTVSPDAVATVSELRERDGKDIWLFGGGQLFEGLLDAHLVDRVEVAIIPVLLGKGIPLLPSLSESASLRLESTEVYPSGIVSLRYRVARA